MEAIKYYVKGAFLGVHQSPEVLEQQEEIIADLTAKVADLVEQGKSEEEALGLAIASMGDLSALVAEFEPAGALPAPIPTTAVKANRLDLFVVTMSAGVGAAVMIASTGFGALAGLIHAGAGLSLLAVLAVGVLWVRRTYMDYAAEPDAIEVREQDYGKRFRNALLVWAGVAIIATLLNITSGTDFWCWPFWVAGGTWALTVKMEQWLTRRPEFLAPESAVGTEAT